MNDIDLQALGSRLRELRRSLGLNQEQLGKKLNLSKTTICDYEKGKTIPSFEFLYRFTRLAQITLDALVYPGGSAGNTALTGDIAADARAGDKGGTPFGNYYPEVMELLDYMKKSPMVLMTVITMARNYISQNKDLIEDNIKLEEEKRKK